MGRPRKTVDAERVRKLAGLGLTAEEIAAVEGVSHDTLERRFAADLAQGRARFTGNLKRLQLRAAKKGGAQVLIWLGKVYLDQREDEPKADLLGTFERAWEVVRRRQAERDGRPAD